MNRARMLAAGLVISVAGATAIIGHEGWENTPYRDIAGVWTVCAGHTATVQPGVTLSDSRCRELLIADTGEAQRAVQRSVNVPITQDQFDALVSFTFNLGAGALYSSTLLRKLNDGQCMAAAEQFLRWNKARVNGVLRPVKGLTVRRQVESAAFASGC